MKKDNKIIGARGEQIAAGYLRGKGYQILESNFCTRFGEIDLICKKDKTVIFVEVKTKTSDEFGEPWEMADRRKLGKVRRMGEVWNMINKWEGMCRIDVVGVWLRDGQVDKIEHWENVE